MSTTQTPVAGSIGPVPSPRAAGRRGRAIAPIRHHSPAEHAAFGEAARRKVPHEAHAGFDVPSRDPVALLESQAATRVADLVPIRYGRMLVSPFTFYRGAAL